MAVSLRWALNTGWVRNLEVRLSGSGMTSSSAAVSSTSAAARALPTREAPNRAATRLAQVVAGVLGPQQRRPRLGRPRELDADRVEGEAAAGQQTVAFQGG